jgi:hypothetical protein
MNISETLSTLEFAKRAK